WAHKEGILPKNPLAGMPRPKPAPRQRALTPEEFQRLYDAAGDSFRHFLRAMRLTGARPKEIRDLRWDQVREDRIVFAEHKTKKKTHKPRVIVLTEEMRQLLGSMPRSSPYVFLNNRGEPWTMNAVRLQVMRIKKKAGLPADVCAYLLRHMFGTQAVLRGV